MIPKIKNIILFAGIAVVLILIYVFVIKKSPAEENTLVSTPSASVPIGETAAVDVLPAGADFLSVLLNVKNIKLDDAIFSDPAFLTLRDSSIVLTPDGTEGRPNPFAPIGSENSVTTFPPNVESGISANPVPPGLKR